ncbi:1,4-alpha-glucan branching protein [Streptomyces griseoviridis]|uniref:Maltokinase N-terminal cap domain-containing protein n=1 Tax=Streptomyces griseoviridis TaxID=45398 RepID=A0A918LF73_STRGD|nr:1,4-alpha-glucan branching protein [Streptomyces niveoruber]GGS38351.1 hypothetical protein GCM10010238_29800 [Streptomyces niveoruber]
MAVIHRTFLKPSKLELLATWLPTRPWYRGGAGEPELARAGGFRLDDPEGEVGIEFMIVTDTAGAGPATYLTPLTYRGTPLAGAEHALIGTAEHGVLGTRWIYDGCHDPVLAARLTALIEGRAQAQAQSTSDTPDREVTRSFTGDGLADLTGSAADDPEGTVLPAPQGLTLRLHRVLRPAEDVPTEAVGHVAGAWRTPDGAPARGVFAVLSAGSHG